jgi:phage baseplate assembly protein W
MGKNLASPFHRAARDFATACGADLFLAKAAQILGTEADSPVGAGELPWRTAFGSTIHLLRHKPNNEALVEVARVRARNALTQWLPSARVTDCESQSDGALLTVVLSVDEVAAGGVPSGASGDVPVPVGPVGPT